MASLDNISISVIICSYNPRQNVFSRVLDGLRGQTMDLFSWQLIVVDNASDTSIDSQFSISWHPHGRIVREMEQGLIYARRKGIMEAKAEVLIFVDDDNVLDPEYLSQVLFLSRKHPSIGVFGGQVIPEFEENPKPWIKPYIGYLAIREFSQDYWGNVIRNDNYPVGAGMIIRKNIALLFCKKFEENVEYQNLGRKKNDLQSGEDIEMVFTALDHGYEIGLFSSLKLIHIIPASRVQEAYMLSLMTGIVASDCWHTYLRKGVRHVPRRPSIRPVLSAIVSAIKWKPWFFQSLLFEYRRYRAIRRGIVKAKALITNQDRT